VYESVEEETEDGPQHGALHEVGIAKGQQRAGAHAGPAHPCHHLACELFIYYFLYLLLLALLLFIHFPFPSLLINKLI
jgi:hypothetical protein